MDKYNKALFLIPVKQSADDKFLCIHVTMTMNPVRAMPIKLPLSYADINL